MSAKRKTLQKSEGFFMCGISKNPFNNELEKVFFNYSMLLHHQQSLRSH